MIDLPEKESRMPFDYQQKINTGNTTDRASSVISFIKARWVSSLLAGLLVVTTASTAYFYKELRYLREHPQTVALSAQEETNALIAKIATHMELPQGEVPTVATVSDPDALKNQPFFANAQKGFKVLIYTNIKKGILYDPVNDKIIDVAPINIGVATDTAGTVAGTTTKSTTKPKPKATDSPQK